MMSNERNVQGSDTTKDDSSTGAGQYNIFSTYSHTTAAAVALNHFSVTFVHNQTPLNEPS